MKPLTLEETGIKTDDNEMCIKGIDESPIFSWNTKTKEFYVLGHKFDGINSIEDFINYIHNLDKENKSLQSQLKSKEEENQEYKDVIFTIKMRISARIKKYQQKIDNEIDMGSQGDYFKICRYEENIKFLKDILKEVE